MVKCSQCGKKLSIDYFTCKFCGETFCSEHRLPESHNCPGLSDYKNKQWKQTKKALKDYPEMKRSGPVPFKRLKELWSSDTNKVLFALLVFVFLLLITVLF